ncbi:MAG: hypothetical protein AB1467_05975 [Candidatus Diapherotrites archaeon]
MGVTDFYYALEDKYYDLMDRIDRVIPIHKIIEPIDKVFPSFILFIIIILLLIGSGIYLALGGLPGKDVQLTFHVTDQSRSSLNAISISATHDSKTESLTTDMTGKTMPLTVKADTIVSYEIDESSYEKLSDSIKVEENKTLTLTLSPKQAFLEGTTRKIRLYDKDNTSELITGTLFHISFSCNNDSAISPDSLDTSNGRTEVTEPSDCDGLSATITGVGYKTENSVFLDQETNNIYLTRLGDQKALLTVETYFEGSPVDDIWVGIYEDRELGPIDEGYTYGGQKSFDLYTGKSYYIKVYDEADIYKEQWQSVYFTGEDTARIDLQKISETGIFITIRVIDEDTRKGVKDAKVTLFKGKDEIKELSTSIDSNYTVKFNVSNNEAEYYAFVDQEDYLIKKLNGLKAGGNYTAELEKFTGDNAATLKVKVIDQDGKPVRNARVALYDEEKSLAGNDESITDLNGMAEFTRVLNGNYYAFAFKGTISGWSDLFNFDKRLAESIEPIVTMVIPDGSIKLIVRDNQGEPMQFATVEFIDAFDGKTIATKPIEDVNGIITFSARADKSVYFKVRKEGMASYHSIVFQLQPKTIQEIQVKMNPELISGDIKIEWIGVTRKDAEVEALSETDTPALSANETYKAKLMIRIPKNKNYSEAGIHFRLGEDIFMENDLLYIKEVYDSEAVIKKFTRYTGNNVKEDLKSMTSSDAKWANIVWVKPETGDHQIEVEFTVKENAFIGQQLTFSYRAWAKEGGRHERDPVDNTLQAGNELYAAVKERIYTVGSNTLCDDQFCFTASIEDLKEGLAKNVIESYTAKIFRKYELKFDIMNNSKEFIHYPEAFISLENSNEAIKFTHYTIRNAENSPVSSFLNDFKIEKINLGEFKPATHVTATIEFETVKPATGSIDITIISRKEIKFTKNISIEVEAPKEFEVEWKPKLIPSGISKDITFTVKDKAEGIEVENASVKIKDRFGDIISNVAFTNRIGEAIVTIPGQAPQSKLKAVIEKEEYKTLEQELITDGNVIEFNPKRLGIALNTKKMPSTQSNFTIKNLLEDLSLTVSSLTVTGDLKGLLDTQAMNSYLKVNYEGTSLDSGEEKEFKLKSILSKAGMEWPQREDLSGNLEVTASNSGSNWVFKLPLKISIGIGGEADNPACLSLTTKEWTDFSEGSPKTIQFNIENSCTINGKPISLNNLEARVEWKSNHIGTYTITIGSNTVDLRSAYYRRLLDRMDEGTISGTLTFTPNGGANGIAQAEISVRAFNPLDGKDQILEDSTSTQISVLNLADCIKFSEDELEIPPESKFDSLKIETLNCGSDVHFTLKSDLRLSKKEFDLKATGSEEIKVDGTGELPGQYNILVSFQGSSLVSKRPLKNIYVRVLEPANACIKLSNYEFNVYDDPADQFDGYDTFRIYNDCIKSSYPAKIKLSWDAKLWNSMKDSFVDSLMFFAAQGFLQKAGSQFGFVTKILDFFGLKATGKITMAYQPQTTVTKTPATGMSILSSIKDFFSGGNLINTAIFFVGDTLYKYFSEEPLELVIPERNTEVMDYRLFLEKGQLAGDTVKDIPETRISIDPSKIALADKYYEFKEGSTEQREVYEARFVNKTGFVQPDALSPLYDMLKVTKKNYAYDTEYTTSNLDKFRYYYKNMDVMTGAANLLEVDEGRSTTTDSKFHVQFNSFNPNEQISIYKGLDNCVIGNMTGKTGAENAPKIQLLWRWNSFMKTAGQGKYPCSETENYCDATQFSIELLERIHEIKGIIESLNLSCAPGTSDCAPYTTVRLNDFINYTEQANGKELDKTKKQRLAEVLNFNAYLIKDGYSADFQKDFDYYAKNVAFFETPSFYSGGGLDKYFSDPEAFKFDYFGAPNSPINGPGIYRITISIEFNDNSWKLIKEDKTNAVITVNMSKTKSAEPDSPFYYIPFDGQIGLTTENGRVGYGTNYENIEGGAININDPIKGEGQINTINIANANTVHNLKTWVKDDFKTMNVDDRGILLKLERTTDETSLYYIPSDMTPVLMETEDKGSANVYSFYSLEMGTEVQRNIGTFLTKWSGIGANCKDFLGRSVFNYSETPDLSALSSEAEANAIIPGDKKAYSYGLVWPDPVRQGKLYLETVFFTPKGQDSVLNMVASSGSTTTKFYTPKSAGSKVSLNGVMISSKQSIDSINKILELMKESKVCVETSGSSQASFFWNPKIALQQLEGSGTYKALNTEESCIK